MNIPFSLYERLNVSVGASALTVIRAARRKLAKKCRRSRKFRTERHAFYRGVLAAHKGARKVYDTVMRGF